MIDKPGAYQPIDRVALSHGYSKEKKSAYFVATLEATVADYIKHLESNVFGKKPFDFEVRFQTYIVSKKGESAPDPIGYVTWGYDFSASKKGLSVTITAPQYVAGFDKNVWGKQKK